MKRLLAVSMGVFVILGFSVMGGSVANAATAGGTKHVPGVSSNGTTTTFSQKCSPNSATRAQAYIKVGTVSSTSPLGGKAAAVSTQATVKSAPDITINQNTCTWILANLVP